MMLFFIWMSLFSFPALTSAAVDMREMSIDEYIKFVNPPPVYKYQSKFGDTILCVKFSDQISVKHASDNITRGLTKPPKLKSWIHNISNFDPRGVNISKMGVNTACPENTVAIREIKREVVEKAGSVRQYLEEIGGAKHITPNVNPEFVEHEYAMVMYQTLVDPITGVTASFNIWKPKVDHDGYFSISHILLSNMDGKETIEVGWSVYPIRYGDFEPRLYLYWKREPHQGGCYDLDCPGFVAMNGNPTPIGLPLSPVSEQKGDQFDFDISIEQEMRDEIGLAWILYYDKVAIGYWPASLFDEHYLGTYAIYVQVGGKVAYEKKLPGRHISRTYMGSGVFPYRGFAYAAYTRDIHIFGTNGFQREEIEPQVKQYESKPKCYKVKYIPTNDIGWGNHIYFGGSGGGARGCVAT